MVTCTVSAVTSTLIAPDQAPRHRVGVRLAPPCSRLERERARAQSGTGTHSVAAAGRDVGREADHGRLHEGAGRADAGLGATTSRPPRSPELSRIAPRPRRSFTGSRRGAPPSLVRPAGAQPGPGRPCAAQGDARGLRHALPVAIVARDQIASMRASLAVRSSRLQGMLRAFESGSSAGSKTRTCSRRDGQLRTSTTRSERLPEQDQRWPSRRRYRDPSVFGLPRERLRFGGAHGAAADGVLAMQASVKRPTKLVEPVALPASRRDALGRQRETARASSRVVPPRLASRHAASSPTVVSAQLAATRLGGA